jgi:octaprenyl-diphosphate synthase
MTPSSAAPREKSASWKLIIRPVEAFLQAVADRLLEQVAEFEPEVSVYARYALANQGKQLRPALVALSGEATGGLNDGLVSAATIIEMVHLATLVHDDVMDAAALRRSRPTLATHAGNTKAVLVGDCLFAHALRMASRFPTTEVCRAVAAATKTVCTGEIVQSEREHQADVSREEYFRILRMKTAELFALACELGASLSGATVRERLALRQYGIALGTAYQIYDDCLDLFGNENAAGKSLRSDLFNGKATMPVIVALERAGPADARALAEMIESWKPSCLARLKKLLANHDALAESRQVIRDLCRSARDELPALAPSEARECLEAASHFVADQADALTDGG